MPLGAGGTLSVQQAWDVATYIDSQVRPQDPRFTGDVDQTRKMHHDTPFSMYGRTVNGAILGDPASTPPAGTVPTGSK
jgi:thiosulfate dehydrogenase